MNDLIYILNYYSIKYKLDEYWLSVNDVIIHGILYERKLHQEEIEVYYKPGLLYILTYAFSRATNG